VDIVNSSFSASGAAMGPAWKIFGSLLWVLASSALLVESDTYRYACAILAVIALVYYVKEPSRPRTNWLGWLCMGWALYVLARFAFIYLTTEHHDMGGSDWLFAFPLFFPILGVAFALYEGEMERIIAAFFVVAVAMLAVTVALTIGTITTGVAVRPLVMNNQIHGAVACGLIFVMSTFWFLHYLTTPDADRRFARLAYVVSPLILVLCVIAIYGAKSKGVWLAMMFTLPVLAIVGMRYIKMRARSGLVMVCAIALLGVGIYAVRHNLDQTAGPTIKATASLFSSVLGSSNHAETITQTIQSDTTPVAMDERLQLWSNGWELFSSAPIFGWGNEWLERWQHTRYAHVSYTLLHNGYLEILVRFGLFGAVVMALILASFIVSVCRACRQGIIPRAAMHAYLVCIFFFALTLLSNSNNRLAIGESLALVTSAFACWCNLRLRPAQENLAGLQAAAG
jgi:O-antigen ligase